VSGLRKDRSEVGGSAHSPKIPGGSDGGSISDATLYELPSALRQPEAQPDAALDGGGVGEGRRGDGGSTSEAASPGELVRRIAQLLMDMEMTSEAPSQQSSDEGTISRSKAGTTEPPGTWQIDDRLVAEWIGMFERLCYAGERALRRYAGQERTVVMLSKEERSARILAYPRDISPTFVAFVEGVTESHVRQLRAKDRADRSREEA